MIAYDPEYELSPELAWVLWNAGQETYYNAGRPPRTPKAAERGLPNATGAWRAACP